jgi:hypothetical protein
MSLCNNKVFTHNRFLYYNRETISQITRSGNTQLFFPREMGGLGFLPSPLVPFKVTRFQHNLANYFTSYYDNIKGKPLTTDTIVQISLVETDIPVIHEEYTGSTQVLLLDRYAPVPSDCFVPESPTLLMSTEEIGPPILKYKFLPTSFLKSFRNADLHSNKRRYTKYIDNYGKFTKRLVYKYTDDFYIDYLDNSDKLIAEILSQSGIVIADLRQQYLLDHSSGPNSIYDESTTKVQETTQEQKTTTET